MTDKSFLEKYNMLPQGEKVLCAVSGGADSMCLLHWLYSKRDELGIGVFAAHYEHGLRGEEAQRDADFVEKFCKEKGIVCVVEHGNVKEYARKMHLSTEEAARELRYAFLQRTAEKLGCEKIATAHNADDNAETMLFNLCRGSGTAGLRGIPPVRDNIIRPLLQCSRAEIEKYLEENSISHVEDSSNDSDDYSRNLIRHHVSPVLRQINPAFAQCAMTAAELLRQDEDCLDMMAAEFIEKHFDGESISCRELKKLHVAVASRVLRKLWKTTLSFEHVNELMKLVSGDGLGFADVPGGRIRRERGRIYFKEESSQPISDRAITINGITDIPEAGIKIHCFQEDFGKEVYGLFNTFALKYENIQGVVFCTAWRHGDKIHPIGRNCGKTLKALFNEKKMTQSQKLACPVIRDDAGVLAVMGFPADERTKAEPGDKVLRLVIEKY